MTKKKIDRPTTTQNRLTNTSKKKPIKAQRNKIRTVMKEFKEGELTSGTSEKKVENPKQAIAIALSEAGLSKNKKPSKTISKKRKSPAKKSTRSHSTTLEEGKRKARGLKAGVLETLHHMAESVSTFLGGEESSHRKGKRKKSRSPKSH